MHSASSILARSQLDQATPVRLVSFIKPIDISRTTLHGAILDQLKSDQHGSRYITDTLTGETHTYAGLASSILKATVLLKHQLGVHPNEYILFHGGNSFQYLSLYFATISLGAIPLQVPSVHFSLIDIQTKLIQFDIRLVVCHNAVDRNHLAKLIKSIAFLQHVVIYDKFAISNESNLEHWNKVVLFNDYLASNTESISREDNLFETTSTSTKACLVLNSNGSTSWPPRMVLYAHQALVEACQVLSHPQLLKHRAGDTALVYGAFEHIENMIMFLAAIFNGNHVVVMPSYDYNCIISVMNEHEVKIAWLSSATFIKMINHIDINLTLNSLIKLVVFGGHFNLTLAIKAFSRFPELKSIRNCYIICETPFPLTIMQLNSKDFNSVGHVAPNTELLVIESIDSQFACEMNKVGMFCARRAKESFALGYIRGNTLEELRYLKVEGDTPNAPDSQKQVWLQTLDYGYYDEAFLVYLHGQTADEKIETEKMVNTLLTTKKMEEILVSHQFVEEMVVSEYFSLWVALIKLKGNLEPKVNKAEALAEISKYLHNKLGATRFENVETLIMIVSSPLEAYSQSGKIVPSLVNNKINEMLSKKRKF